MSAVFQIGRVVKVGEQKMTSDKSKSRALAEFTANLSWEAIPDSVKHRAKLQILDAIGVGVAARS